MHGLLLCIALFNVLEIPLLIVLEMLLCTRRFVQEGLPLMDMVLELRDAPFGGIVIVAMREFLVLEVLSLENLFGWLGWLVLL